MLPLPSTAIQIPAKIHQPFLPLKQQHRCIIAYTEMEFTAFLVEVSGHKHDSSQTRVFVWFSALIFPFYIMLFMKRLEFSCFADFFVRIFINQRIVRRVWFSLKSASRRDCE
jgi:hypothetical protein